MRHLIWIAIALAIGFVLTFLFYVIGGVWVKPALFLARIFFEDRGGESLMLPYLVINTVLCALLIYAALFSSTKMATWLK